jgi:hypothetical protein
VAHLSTIQQEIRQLNKPIGYRVEDAEDVLTAYEKILKDLKDFKAQLEELHRTSGANVNELKALLKQQEDLVRIFQAYPAIPGCNPTTPSYNASDVKIYKATGSLAHFENKKSLFYFEKRSSPLQRLRCSCM